MSRCDGALIALGMMPDLFGVSQQTAHRWNTDKGGHGRLPAPDLNVGKMPLWFEDTILEWASTRRPQLTLNVSELDRIRRNQLVR